MNKDLTTIDGLIEEIPIHWSYEETGEFLQNFVAKLQCLNELLSQNSYVKETTKVLNFIIKDAQNCTMVLLAGMTGTGKTSLVNALLRRPILSPEIKVTTAVNSIICYGETEEVRAHFLDGQVASFTIDKVELFTSLDTSSARILREGLDFIEIYVRNDLLKMITLIDTAPLQISRNDTAYIKETILNRADDVFWLFKYGQKVEPGEIKLLEKLKKNNMIPFGILNGIDLIEGKTDDEVSEYETLVSEYMREVVGVSAKEAMEAILEENDEKWKHSQIDLLLSELEKIANNHAKRLAFLTERFIHWLKRFQTELEIIQEREPYVTSYAILKDCVESLENIEIREAAQNKHLGELVALYEKQSIVFKDIGTLYQLIQVIDTKPFRDKREIITFKEHAEQYLSSVREYRKLHQEYNAEFEKIDKKHRKINGISLLKNIFGRRAEDGYFKEQIEQLNVKQQKLEKEFHLLKLEEEKLKIIFSDTNEMLNEIVQSQLASISKDFTTIEFQRNSQDSKIQNAIKKLEGFDSIIEAQAFILKFVKEYVLVDDFILTKDEKKKLEHTLEVIKNVKFDYQTYIDQYQQAKPISNDKIQSMVIETNPFYPLGITVDDILAHYEEPPKLVQINNQ